MNKGIFTRAAIVLMCLLSGCGCFHLTAAAGELSGAEEYLSKTGLTAQEINALDMDIRQFIAEDLTGAGEGQWKVNRDVQSLTTVHSEPDAVAFYITVYVFQMETSFRFYAVYESSTGIMPVGNDSLSLNFGDRFAPLEYGGQLWYKKAGDENWTEGGRLSADRQTLEGAGFTGRQLGDFQRKMLIKGCVWCCAAEGEGNDARVIVDYIHKPPKENDEAGIYILIVAATVVVVLILRGKREI